ncbi:putative nwd2 protein [Mycena venus]|uniref:Putative nwd2 protein n=1 Tax=Mycena venus TaxID=2733690 RepID=A0A8H7CEM4_9AGAR|nr:putative nwd2 protein [Mycena venus]
MPQHRSCPNTTMSFVPPPPTPGRSLVSHEPATLVEAYRVFQSSTYNHTQSGGTFNHVAGNQVRNEYKYNVAGNFIQSHGENGINLLQRNISGDSLHNSEQRFPPPLCHPDTRTAVQNIIQAWAADTDRQAPSVIRPEPHIRETFDSLPGTVTFRRLILDNTFNPGRDILRYLRDRFSEIRRRRLPYEDDSWPSERDLERLVHNASGQFIYAATVLKFVDDEYCHPMDQLFVVLSLSTTSTETGTPPFSDLDTLYTYILSANPNISLMMRILEQYTVSIMNYGHKYWTNHCIFHWINYDILVQEQQFMIRQCLRCFRDVLSPVELAILCDDIEGMTRRFLRIIDFLNSFQHVKSIQLELSRDVDDTWNTLLTALFDPIPAVARFYEGWAIQHHGLGFDISSSLGIVFKHLWPNGYDRDPAPPSYEKVAKFLSCHPSLQVRRVTAEISMRLLMCRNAELHAYMRGEDRSDRIYDYFRPETHWSFARHWCRHLTQAPATAELLAMLRVLIENTFFTRTDEINYLLLKQWLDEVPRDLKTQGQEIYTAIEAARPILPSPFSARRGLLEWPFGLHTGAEPHEPGGSCAVLSGQRDAIQPESLFTLHWTLLATMCHDRNSVCLIPVLAVTRCAWRIGIKGSCVVWIGNLKHDRMMIARTGFSAMSDRQVAVWETGALGKTIVLDQSAGVLMLF